MVPTASKSPMAGSVKILRVFGIAVHLHWSWLIVAFYGFRIRDSAYDSSGWVAAEYFSLFVIVLLHEFGHALACRQTGGKADHIVLWPLGGIAFVNPPPRPGAWLWSIAAGPLVNVVLVPVLMAAALVAEGIGLRETTPDAYQFILTLGRMNFGLLVFNLLPIYPLDGGQILYSLLWFVVGRAKALMIASAIGLVMGVIVVGLAIWFGAIWIGIVAAFITLQSFIGLLTAIRLRRESFTFTPPNEGSDRPREEPLDAVSMRIDEPALAGEVVSRCEECGTTSVFPAWKSGYVTKCPGCRAAMDVGPAEEGEEWWKGEDVPEDESGPPK